MSGPAFDRGDDRLKAVVQSGLEARDRSMPAPRFPHAFAGAAESRPRGPILRPAFAALAALAVLAGATWVYSGRQSELPVTDADLHAAAVLARELSSTEYWRVPTDELLAFAAPPLSAELPSPEGFHVSLEETLL